RHVAGGPFAERLSRQLRNDPKSPWCQSKRSLTTISVDGSDIFASEPRQRLTAFPIWGGSASFRYRKGRRVSPNGAGGPARGGAAGLRANSRGGCRARGRDRTPRTRCL